MRRLGVLYTVCVFFVWLVVIRCSEGDANSETNACQNGDTNYTRIYTSISSVSVPTKLKTNTIKLKTCSGWFLWRKCETKYRDIYQIKNITHYKTIELSETKCCPGFVDYNGSCIAGCPNNTYGSNCSEACDCPANALNQCDRDTGNCTCLPGWQGTNCSEACSEGMYGMKCESHCFCKNNASCDQVTGDCQCQPGWWGDSCDHACDNNTYGDGCNQTCNCSDKQECDHVTGSCKMCSPGWTDPPYCNTSCPDWTYGTNCSSNCTCHKEGTYHCNSTSGGCLCHDGYTGPGCNEECALGTFGKNCSKSCTNCTSGLCDPINGTCMCFGNKGDNCTEECDDYTFGFDCSTNCTCNEHHSNGSCDPCSGTCYCDDGWTGPNCDRECPASLDQDECQSFRLYNNCDPFTVTWECKAGWTGQFCDTVCSNGTFGENCSDPCMCNETSQDCNPVTGDCVCKPGLTGDKCEQYCLNNTYGFKCQSNCNCSENMTCHHVNGSCACIKGWDGDFCLQDMDNLSGAKERQTDDDMTVYIAGATGAFLATTIVIAVVAFVYKKRRSNREDKTELDMSAVHTNSTFGKPKENDYVVTNSIDNYDEANETKETQVTRKSIKNSKGRESEQINPLENEDGVNIYESGDTIDENENDDIYDDENNYADVDDEVKRESDPAAADPAAADPAAADPAADDPAALNKSKSNEISVKDEEPDITDTNTDETYDVCDSLGNNIKPIIDDTYNTFEEFKHPKDSEEEDYDVVTPTLTSSIKKKSFDADYNTFAQVRKESKKLKAINDTDDNRDSDSYDNLGYQPHKMRFETDIYSVAVNNPKEETKQSKTTDNSNTITSEGVGVLNDDLLNVDRCDISRISEPVYEECLSNKPEPVEDISNDDKNESDLKTFTNEQVKQSKSSGNNSLNVIETDTSRISEPLYEECLSNETDQEPEKVELSNDKRNKEEPEIVMGISNDSENDDEKSITCPENEEQSQNDIAISKKEAKPESYENCVLPASKPPIQEKDRQNSKTLKSRERRAVDYEDFALKY